MVELLKSSVLTTSPLAMKPPAVNEVEFRRLRRMLGSGENFRLIFAQFNDPRVRAEVIRRVALVAAETLTLTLDHERFPAFHSLEDTIAEKAPHHRVIHLVEVERWLNAGDRERLIAWFNYRREKLAERSPAAVVLWLLEPTVKEFAIGAPDFWAWREGVVDFSTVQDSSGFSEFSVSSANWERAGLPRERKIKRIESLKDHLNSDQQLPPSVEAEHLSELGSLYFSIAEYSKALPCLNQSLTIWREIGDRAGEGTTLNNISQIYDARGDYETALKYLEESLTIRRETGDLAGMCPTLFNIGHIHFQRRSPDKAEQAWVSAYQIASKVGLAKALNHLDSLAKQLGHSGLEYWEQLATQLRPDD